TPLPASPTRRSSDLRDRSAGRHRPATRGGDAPPARPSGARRGLEGSDALAAPLGMVVQPAWRRIGDVAQAGRRSAQEGPYGEGRSEEHTSELQSREN